MSNKVVFILGLIALLALVLSACATPSPEVQVVTKVVEVEKEVTKIVESTPVVEKVVETQVVEVVVTPTPTPKPTGPRHGGTLTIIIPEEVKGLYNQADSGTEGEYPLNQITDGLVNADIDRNIVPGLAESWEISDDGLDYTFHLRQGVKFHDGTDFDAEDVKWTMDQAIIPGSYSANKWEPYIAGTEIIDQYTVKITLKAPWYDFMNLLAFEEDLDILSREAVEKWGDDYGYKAAVGTGPFKFDHWNRGEELVLVRNEDYWGAGEEGLPYLDSIVYRAVVEDSVKLIQLATKNADVIYTVPFNEVSALDTDPNVVVDSTPGGTVHFLAMVTNRPPFDDIRVRQALNYAIDRQAIVDTIFAGQATVANGLFPPMLFVSENDKVFYPYDPDKAKQLLEEAGYTSDNPLKFLLLTSNASLYQDEAVLVQAQLKEIGVEVEVLPLEKAALSTYTQKTAPDSEEKRQAFLYRYGYSGTFINDYTYRTYYSGAALNLSGYNQPGAPVHSEVDELLVESIQLVDKDKILENNHKLNEMIMMDAPWVRIAFQNNVIAYQSHVKGLKNWPLCTMPMVQVWLDQ
jgi:ABC-type transport system substrate-binding protein